MVGDVAFFYLPWVRLIHGKGIWVFRLVMITAVGLHAWAALTTTLANHADRPVGYRAKMAQAATWARRLTL